MVGIYKITSPSGKVYIGQSHNVPARLRSYRNPNRSKEQRHLHYSFLKYGTENHQFEVLLELPADVEQGVIDRLEQTHMDAHAERGIQLLNIKAGGLAGKHSAETKRRLSVAQKGRKHSAEHVAKRDRQATGSVRKGS